MQYISRSCTGCATIAPVVVSSVVFVRYGNSGEQASV
jgi:hypothetical protein